MPVVDVVADVAARTTFLFKDASACRFALVVDVFFAVVDFLVVVVILLVVVDSLTVVESLLVEELDVLVEVLTTAEDALAIDAESEVCEVEAAAAREASFLLLSTDRIEVAIEVLSTEAGVTALFVTISGFCAEIMAKSRP